MDSEQELAFPVTFNVLTRIRCGSLPALWKKNGAAFWPLLFAASPTGYIFVQHKGQ